MHDQLIDHLLKKDNPRNRFRGLPIISDQITQKGLGIVCTQLEKVLDTNTPGAIVEFGCYAGTTSLFIRRSLDAHNESKRPFHVYDSFAGLPPKRSEDHNAAGVAFEAGKLYVSKKEFLHQFRIANLVPPIVHKGWFNQLTDEEIPAPIAFAFLDGDFYDSILSSLRLVWPKLSPEGVILIDDYKRETLPGVERAVHDFIQGKGVEIRLEHNIAILTTKVAF